MEDPRFAHIKTDPRYKRAPRRAHKVTVDKRFQSMFTDESFKVKYRVDKRGKKVSLSSTENMKKYYQLDEEEEEEDEEPGGEEKDDCEKALEDEDVSNSDNEDVSDSDSSSIDEDIDALSSLNEEITHNWSEWTAGVERSRDTSHRLAVCNMDWDRITAQDVYVLFNSFKPQNGLVHFVKIYTSDFGKERLEKEEIEGPAELLQDNEGILKGEGENPDIIEGKDFAREKLRQYQLSRLKYFYAIVECDSKATAEHIYEQCDGLEYEHSASTIDVRFVPDDIIFDDREPVAMATENSVSTDFIPSEFFTSALQQTKVNLTWDETDPSRLRTTMRKFDEDDLLNMDFGNYLASSSDEEGVWLAEGATNDTSDKYRALLGLEDNSNDKGQEEEEELQITWNIGLKEKGKKILKSKKAKEMKKPSSSNKKLKRESLGTDSREEDELGFDDPFFTQELTALPTAGKKRKRPKLTATEQEEIQKQKEELELLMMSDDEDGGKKHFNLNEIMMERNKESGKKKRRKRKMTDKNETTKSEFNIDVKDPRFSALYESHLYAIDPSDPHYKATKGMEDILSEKQKRSKNKKENGLKENSSTDHSLSVLVKSIKSKTTTFQEMKRKKKRHNLLS